MLFELGGKRKRVIQVIYVCLAGLMFIALVGFGIGGATGGGGIFDALGIGGSNTSSDPQYDQQIDNAQQALQANPKDEKALLKLARYNFLEGQTSVDVDAQGRSTLTDETLNSYRAATDAWERYLATHPKQPDDNVAGLMLNVYSSTAGTDPSTLERDVTGAFKSAQIVADARPSLGSYVDLATWAYLAGDDKTGAKAEKQALSEAPDSSTKKQVQAQITQAKQQRALVVKALKQNAPDQSQLQDPLGGLGSSGALPSTGATP
jgi:tetratricopeptide (TPR) repeat protein